MNLEDFKELVYKEFGSDLRHATPANVKEFLNRLQQMRNGQNGPFVLKEKHVTLEAILKDFFARALEMPKDDALILLWTVGMELAFGMVEDHLESQLSTLFKGLDD